MQTHISREGMHFPKCDRFDPADVFVAEGEIPSCLECRFYDEAVEAWEKYVSQPINFGEESHTIRFIERDAFFTGFFAGVSQTVPF